jgi:hypothetical protein
MPVDNPENRGTEKDGSKSELYCKYCYRGGKFMNPEMSLEEMKNLVVTQMHKMNLPENIIQLSVKALPGLQRWSRKVPVMQA